MAGGHYPPTKTALPASLALRHMTEFSVTACRQKGRVPHPHQGFKKQLAPPVLSSPLLSEYGQKQGCRTDGAVVT